MRAVFGVLSLLVVVAIVGVLAKKQLGTPTAATAPAPAGTMARPTGTPQQQVQKFEQALQGTMQQARPMPEDK